LKIMAMELKRISCPLVEVKADGDANSNEGVFSGYGSTFGNLDLGGDIIKAGAFTKSLNDWGMKGEMPFLLAFHDMSRPIGDWLEMREDEKGLFVRGQLWVKGDRRIEDAVMAYNMLRGTGQKTLSIGYRVNDYEMQESMNGSIRVIKEIDLVEVSIVPCPMNPQAKITAVKSLKDEEGNILSKREVERALRDAGLSTRQAKAFIAGGYEALERDAKELVEPAGREDQLDEAGILASLQKKGGIS
jgi:HK97 family phage prohead protease